MAVPTPKSGEVVAAADVEAMHEVLRTLVNGMPVSAIGRHALGPQHLPSGVVGKDHVCVTTEYTVTWDRVGGPPSHDILEETIADIQSGNWLTMTAYDLDNGGAGYTLPPCKVLVFFTCRVTEFLRYDPDNQLWFNIHATIDGTPTYDMRQSGMIFPNEEPNPDQDVANNLVEQPVSIAFVIDQAAAAGNWVLDQIRVKAGAARGLSNVGAWTAKVTAGTMSFIAFYKDE